ncbi:MAG: LPS-assembly protein LptD, partial [Gammaproteobacteria bacterium]|nr:LPS-assembly protein LptD [Gammaproteobacteria bacterium]
MRYNSVSNTFSLAAILLMSPVLVSAGSGDMWSLCGPLQSGPAKPKWEDGEIDRETLQLTADEAELVQDGVSILRGDVQMRKGERQFQAGTVFYDQQAEVLEISDGVRLWDSDIYMSGSRANYDLSSDEGQIDDANYYLLDDHGRGGAGTIR